MHEMSIAASLVDHVLEIGREQRARRIEVVEVEVGVLRQVVPGALQVAFAALTVDTVAEGAVLQLTETKAVAQCRSCQVRYDVAIDCYLCPRCHQADVQVLSGNDIVLKSVVCQSPECAETV